jgi:COP9 signalosome complex subunit 4
VFYVAAREALSNWDKQIQSLCFQVNNIIEKISQHSPEFMAKVSADDQMVQS